MEIPRFSVLAAWVAWWVGDYIVGDYIELEPKLGGLGGTSSSPPVPTVIRTLAGLLDPQNPATIAMHCHEP